MFVLLLQMLVFIFNLEFEDQIANKEYGENFSWFLGESVNSN